MRGNFQARKQNKNIADALLTRSPDVGRNDSQNTCLTWKGHRIKVNCRASLTALRPSV